MIGSTQAALLAKNRKLGPELVVNGDFGSSLGWSLGTGWSISNGQAHSDGSQTIASNLARTSTMQVGKFYLATIVVSAVSNEYVSFLLGATGTAIVATKPGAFSAVAQCKTSTTIYIAARPDFVGSIDMVSIREILS